LSSSIGEKGEVSDPGVLDIPGAKSEKICDVILLAPFGDATVMTSLNWHHNYLFKLDLVIISLKMHNPAKLLNFWSPIDSP